MMASTSDYSGNFTKWFAYFLEKGGAKTPGTSFHSFRHSYCDVLRNFRVEKEFEYALDAWAVGSVDSTPPKIMGVVIQAATLLEAIEFVHSGMSCLDHLSR